MIKKFKETGEMEIDGEKLFPVRVYWGQAKSGIIVRGADIKWVQGLQKEPKDFLTDEDYKKFTEWYTRRETNA